MTPKERRILIEIYEDQIDFDKKIERSKRNIQEAINSSIEQGEIKRLNKRLAQLCEIEKYIEDFHNLMDAEPRTRPYLAISNKEKS